MKDKILIFGEVKWLLYALEYHKCRWQEFEVGGFLFSKELKQKFEEEITAPLFLFSGQLALAKWKEIRTGIQSQTLSVWGRTKETGLGRNRPWGWKVQKASAAGPRPNTGNWVCSTSNQMQSFCYRYDLNLCLLCWWFPDFQE